MTFTPSPWKMTDEQVEAQAEAGGQYHSAKVIREMGWDVLCAECGEGFGLHIAGRCPPEEVEQ